MAQILFYGGFSVDAILSALSAYTKRNDANDLFLKFWECSDKKNYIAYFQELLKNQKEIARAKRAFGDDLFKFIEQFKDQNLASKIQEQNGYDFGLDFEAKMDEIRGVMHKKESDFWYTAALSGLCLFVGNVLGALADSDIVGKGKDTDTWNKIGDWCWVLINFSYEFLDADCASDRCAKIVKQYHQTFSGNTEPYSRNLQKKIDEIKNSQSTLFVDSASQFHPQSHQDRLISG